MEEEWKVYKITKHSNQYKKAGVYEVSNKGNVKLNGIITEPNIAPGGYKRIGGFYVHRAVAELFIPNPENKPQVDHIDTNPSNNHVDNLRWVNIKENINNPLTLKHRSEVYNTPEYIQKISEGAKVAQNRPEVIQKKSKASKEYWSNSEHRQKQSEAMLGRICINKDNKEKRIKKDQLSLFLNKGWKLGKK